MSPRATFAVLGVAQFVMVLDTTVMNVSISQVVSDLHTTVTSVQAAITLYALVMAAFMLSCAKLGDLWGRRRAFTIGIAVYGVGSLTTALSGSITMLLIGWSLVEGLGAVLSDPGDRGAHRHELPGQRAGGGVRDARRHRGRLDGRRPADRGLRDDHAQLAGGVRRRDGGDAGAAASLPWDGRHAAHARHEVRQAGRAALRAGPGADRVPRSCRAASGGSSCRGARSKSPARR